MVNSNEQKEGQRTMLVAAAVVSIAVLIFQNGLGALAFFFMAATAGFPLAALVYLLYKGCQAAAKPARKSQSRLYGKNQRR